MRRWLKHLFHEWTIESWRPIAPAFAKPEPSKWSNTQLTLAWLGHSTVLINFFGATILTDPVLFPRVGIRLPGFTIGPKRLTAPALHFHDLPHIDAILLSHAHFDHLDLRTLRCFDKTTLVIIARATSNHDGRTDAPLIGGQPLPIGRYELRFHLGDYFGRMGVQQDDPPFLDVVPVRFAIAEPEGHYHVPLLVTPWSYSTYRGS